VSVYYAIMIPLNSSGDPVKLTSAGRSGYSDVIEFDGRAIVIYIDYDTNAFGCVRRMIVVKPGQIQVGSRLSISP